MSAKIPPLREPRPLTDFSRQTIMAVEDSDDDVRLLKRALRLAEIRNPIQILRNGEEAQNYLEGQNRFKDRRLFPLPIAILLDLKMPLMNGFELLEWMNTQPRLRPVWKVVITNSTSGQDMDRAYALGASFFLTKPCKVAHLAKMTAGVMEWLRLNQFPRERPAVRERKKV